MAITDFDPRNPQVQCTSGKVPQIIHGLLEANSQSFKAGEFVYSNAGAITVSNGGDIPILGIALKAGSNVTTGNVEIQVQALSNDDEVLIQVEDGSGNLEASDTTCTVGKAYDNIVSSNHHRIDSSDTTNPKFIYLGPVYDGTGASSYWGRFRPYYLENQITGGIA